MRVWWWRLLSFREADGLGLTSDALQRVITTGGSAS